MMQPTILNAMTALMLIVGAIIAIAAFARRLGLAGALQQQWGVKRTGSARSCQVARGRTLSIIDLGGWQFAVLTGGSTDQLVVLAPANRDDQI